MKKLLLIILLFSSCVSKNDENSKKLFMIGLVVQNTQSTSNPNCIVYETKYCETSCKQPNTKGLIVNFRIIHLRVKWEVMLKAFLHIYPQKILF